MARQSEDSIPASERTDELPALTPEAIRRYERSGQYSSDDPARGLDQSLEVLRSALDLAEERWIKLEMRLEEQDRTIARLQRELFTRAASNPSPRAAAPVPELTEVVAESANEASPAGSPDIAGDPGNEESGAGHDTRDTPPPGAADRSENTPSDQAFLERIADLETYIAGRADRWRDMEAELDGNARRIAELESELRQRIVREQSLTDRLHQAGGLSDALRKQLRRLHFRLESREDGAD